MIVFVEKKPPSPKGKMSDFLNFEKTNSEIKSIFFDIKSFYEHGKITQQMPFNRMMGWRSIDTEQLDGTITTSDFTYPDFTYTAGNTSSSANIHVNTVNG